MTTNLEFYVGFMAGLNLSLMMALTYMMNHVIKMFGPPPMGRGGDQSTRRPGPPPAGAGE